MNLLVKVLVAAAFLVSASPRTPEGAGSHVARSLSRPPGYGPRPAARWVRPVLRDGCHGVRIGVHRSIQHAISSHPRGTTFCILRGVHRLARPLVAKSNDRFLGEPGAVLNGSLLLRHLEHVGRYWVTGEVKTNPVVAGRCAPAAGESCTLANDVYVDGRVLRRVMRLGDVGSGRFFFDSQTSRMYVGTDPRGHKVEVGLSNRAFQGVGVGSYNVTVRNLAVEKFANEAQSSAIAAGRGWIVAGNEVRLNHGGGIDNASVIRDNYVHDNGQAGIGGSGPHLLADDNEISFNNYARFCACWEAGGAKWSEADHLVVTNNYVHDNIGPGLWTDGSSIHVLYRGNTVARNSGAGIFHEISYQATIRNNVVRRNGFGWKGWLEGAGILINSSPNVNVYRNVVTNNKDGIGITQWDRGSDNVYGPHQDHDILVHDNKVTMTGGFTGLLQGVDDPAYYTDKNNRFERNSYYLGCAARYFVWGTPSSSGYAALKASQWRGAGMDVDGRFKSTCRRRR